jgi:hypothetical protein
MKTNFIDKGTTVILGNTGAMSRLNLGSDELNAEHAEFRRYTSTMSRIALALYGLVSLLLGQRIYRGSRHGNL